MVRVEKKVLILALAAVLQVRGKGAEAAPQQVQVQVQEVQVKAQPSFVAAPVTTLKYGDWVSLLEERMGWCRIKIANGQEGWVHRSAVSTRRVTLVAGQRTVETGATADELALAGKGFSAEVEAEYRKQKNLDFSQVDRMEKMQISADELRRFLLEGKLTNLLGGEL